MRTQLLLALMIASSGALADPGAAVTLIIRGHVFVPANISIRAGTQTALLIQNQDASDEEFESYEMNREKVIPSKGHETVLVGPLPPGRYPFFGEFHSKTAQGVLIAQ
jgi:hypothetical protein